MLRKAARVGMTILLAGGLSFATGCPPPPLPPPDEIAQRLSYTVLQPEMTCAELRDQFGLEGLPVVDNPAEIGIPYEEHQIPAPDGESLRIWYMPTGAGRGTVIVSPGNSGTMACYLFTSRLLTNSGWSVVSYDYEGFGGSTGTASLSTLRSDLETVVDWTLRRTGEGRVSLFGISLGTMPTVAVAVDRPAMINGVVLDSPIALGLEIERFAFLIRNQTDAVIAALEPWLLSEQVIDQMLQPMLIYEHGQDIITPPKEVELLFERAGGPKEIVRYPDLDHARGQFVETADYDAHMEAFLANVWSPPTDP